MSAEQSLHTLEIVIEINFVERVAVLVTIIVFGDASRVVFCGNRFAS